MPSPLRAKATRPITVQASPSAASPKTVLIPGDPKLRPPYVDLEPALDCNLARDLVRWEHRGVDVPSTWATVLRFASVADVADVLRFQRAGYTRTRIARTPEAEVLLMCWLPGQATSIHDHGQAMGLVHVIAGEAVEHEYERVGRKLEIVRTQRFKTSDRFKEPVGGIHRVMNEGPGILVTLHLNVPPLEAMHLHTPDEPADR